MKKEIYTISRAKVACYDCGRSLENSLDWEPFVHLCACPCGEAEHIALCGECISTSESLASSALGFGYDVETINVETININQEREEAMVCAI